MVVEKSDIYVKIRIKYTFVRIVVVHIRKMHT
jgi:hypothetical protein